MTFFRKRNRLPEYDYSNPAYYFVTLCIEKHIRMLGNVIKNKVILNDIGKTINNHWRSIPSYYKNIELDEYIIMPNHIHGIITINQVEDAILTSEVKFNDTSKTEPDYDLTKMQLSKIVQQF